MTEATISLTITMETLIKAISKLSLEQKEQLADIIEQQIFEEEDLEEDEETKAAIQKSLDEYAAGDYITWEEYKRQRDKHD